MEYILEVENLNKSFKDFQLKDVSFKIPKGVIMGLVGENGSGKTTTIKSILDIVKRDGGRIKFFNKDLDENEMEIKQDIGVVLDNKFFQHSMNPKDISDILSLVYDNWDKENFFHYMESYNLPFNQEIGEFSKGMMMKLSIATALSHDAKLLILDEPTAGLDPIVRIEILDELLKFMEDGKRSILFSSHITSDLDKIADYITLMHDGEILLSDDRETILTDLAILKASRDDVKAIDENFIVRRLDSKTGYQALIQDSINFRRLYPDLIVDKVTIEDIMLFYIKGEI